MPRPPGLFWSGFFVLKRDDQDRPATVRCSRQDCPMVKWKEGVAANETRLRQHYEWHEKVDITYM